MRVQEDLTPLIYCIHNIRSKALINKVVYPEALSNQIQPGKIEYKFKWRLESEKDFNKFHKALKPLKVHYAVNKLHQN